MALKNIGRSVGDALYRQVGRVSSYTQRNRSLPYDILEDETSYLVVFDAPGGDPDELQVRFVDGAIAVHLDRFRDHHDGFEMRFPGRAMAREGKATLPDDAVVDPDSGTARFTEVGTINVEIPKADSPDVEGPALESEPSADDIVVDD